MWSEERLKFNPKPKLLPTLTRSNLIPLSYALTIIVTSEAVPQLVGLLGILAGIIVLLGNYIKILKPNPRVPATATLFPILFETIVGGGSYFLH